MAKRPKSNPGTPASEAVVVGEGLPINADPDRRQVVSSKAEHAIIRLARLLGRQIAREQHENVTEGSSPPIGRQLLEGGGRDIDLA
ncbi:hypothetical protein [Bosea sp. TND4EK4]|uniref:hypothetical protein n=1 Tax=Bosea sp. TND4EK4 TaxID=1907408 RepID=UPI0009542F4C|nr:hypothetical protein [Bosea sp. TND4EK4]SIR62713.1 hypothetical protein SAMN05880592_1472 [Bosea sp. TND4EK4]